MMRSTFILVLIIIIVAFHKAISQQKQDRLSSARIDCYPEIESPYSNFSKESCLARHCLYDDDDNSSRVQCYLSPNYGYILQNFTEISNNSIKFYLKRNPAVGSMFPDPMENVIFEIQHYTNEIIRFKFYDADKKRYEVRMHENHLLIQQL